VATNGINNKLNHKSFFNGAGKAAVIGAISAGVSAAIGEVAVALSQTPNVNSIGVSGFQALAHGFSGAIFSASSGGSPLSGFFSGGISSVISSVPLGSDDLGSTLIKGGISGGIGAEIAGGNFWDGMRQGLITSGLNHYAHRLTADDCCASSGSSEFGEGGNNHDVNRKLKEQWDSMSLEEQQAFNEAVKSSLFFIATSMVPVAKIPKIFKFFRGLTSKSGPTIIGEGMKRVSMEAAKNPGSKILNNMPKFSGTAEQITSQMMAYNRKWILQQMRSGRPILDIGFDLARKYPSIFYQMERNMVKNYLKLNPGAFKVLKK